MSGIKVGDYVKVEFTDSPEAGTYTIEGKVHTRGEAEVLWLGPRCIKITGDWVPGRTILEHEPPRMDEPDEFGAMVEARTSDLAYRQKFVRTTRSGLGGSWWAAENGDHRIWSELIDPQPVSPI